jgi:hypothetical protein
VNKDLFLTGYLSTLVHCYKCQPFPPMWRTYPVNYFTNCGKIRGALCRSMSPNFNVPNVNELHINGSLLQPWVVYGDILSSGIVYLVILKRLNMWEGYTQFVLLSTHKKFVLIPVFSKDFDSVYVSIFQRKHTNAIEVYILS